MGRPEGGIPWVGGLCCEALGPAQGVCWPASNACISGAGTSAGARRRPAYSGVIKPPTRDPAQRSPQDWKKRDVAPLGTFPQHGMVRPHRPARRNTPPLSASPVRISSSHLLPFENIPHTPPPLPTPPLSSRPTARTRSPQKAKNRRRYRYFDGASIPGGGGRGGGPARRWGVARERNVVGTYAGWRSLNMLPGPGRCFFSPASCLGWDDG